MEAERRADAGFVADRKFGNAINTLERRDAATSIVDLLASARHDSAWPDCRNRFTRRRRARIRRKRPKTAANRHRCASRAAAETRVEQSAEEWTREIERLAKEHGADAVGIATMRDEWVFDTANAPRAKWIIVLGVAHDYEEIRTAPEERAAAEVSRQYGRGIRAAKGIASALRSKGWDAFAHGGPMAGDFAFINTLAHFEAGLGGAGKHDSRHSIASSARSPSRVHPHRRSAAPQSAR